MAEVFVDGEKVEFRGDSPRTIGEVLDFVQGVLSGQARVVSALLVDGEARGDEVAEVPLESASRVDVASISQSEALGRLVKASVEEIDVAAADGRALSREVLRQPWPKARDRCVSLAEKCGGLVQNVSVLVQHLGEEAAFSRSAGRLNEALSAWVDAIGRGDAAGVCLQWKQGVTPAFDELRRDLDLLENQAP